MLHTPMYRTLPSATRSLAYQVPRSGDRIRTQVQVQVSCNRLRLAFDLALHVATRPGAISRMDPESEFRRQNHLLTFLARACPNISSEPSGPPYAGAVSKK
jgi:hypothetical protein